MVALPSIIFNSAAVAVTNAPANLRPLVPSWDAILKSLVPSDTDTSPLTVKPVNVPTLVIAVCAAPVTVAADPLALPIISPVYPAFVIVPKLTPPSENVIVPLSASSVIPPLEFNVTVVPANSAVPSAMIEIFASAPAVSVVTILKTPLVPTVNTAVSLVEPVIVITLLSNTISSTVTLVNLPVEGVVAPIDVPSIVPLLIVKSFATYASATGVPCQFPIVIVPTAVTWVCDASTVNVFPDLLKPVPAVIWPAPLNWVNDKSVVSNVIVSLVVNTKPLSPLIVPSSTNINIPAVTSEEIFASLARVGAPLAFTV